jgi:hypothetical protein
MGSNYLGTGSLSEEFYEKMAAILNKMATISCVDKKTSRPTECMFEVIFAICFTVQNVSEPLLILTERSIIAYIAIILSENNLSDIIIEEIVCNKSRDIIC